MKKILFFAATAMLFAACANDDLAIQDEALTAAAPDAVSFDVYTAAATRAGDPEGVMTTDKLKFADKGFGVFAMYQDNADYSSATTPNFMFNEHVHWTTSWTYSPLKYWPNETTKDSQTTPATADDCDKVSFFAYAPYVDLSAGTGSMETNIDGSAPVNAYIGSPAETYGILSYSKEDRANDPLVEWKYSANLDKNVDLLWGVAPNGMAYQSVNPSIYIDKTFGLPLLDMVKPDKDQKIKFLFQHALSRIGFSVVSAIDQIAAGDDGAIYDNTQTRVLIKSVEIWGDFGKQGVLNLNNTSANVANWIAASIDKSSVSDLAALYSFTGNAIAKDLRYVDAQITAAGTDANNFNFVNRGVLPSEATLLEPGVDLGNKVESTTPTYAYGTTLYHKVADDYVIATVASAAIAGDGGFVKDASGNYQQVCASAATLNLDGTTKYYDVTATSKNANTTPIAIDDVYYTRTGSDGSYVYTYHKATAAITSDFAYYTLAASEVAAGGTYAADTYYTGMPRYFMVIPTGDTNIKVKISYAVVTKDEKLTGKVSNVENIITKETSLNLQSGKSYNLKLILGLTSVKLDATVADWQVDGSTEINLPRNNE